MAGRPGRPRRRGRGRGGAEHRGALPGHGGPARRADLGGLLRAVRDGHQRARRLVGADHLRPGGLLRRRCLHRRADQHTLDFAGRQAADRGRDHRGGGPGAEPGPGPVPAHHLRDADPGRGPARLPGGFPDQPGRRGKRHRAGTARVVPGHQPGDRRQLLAVRRGRARHRLRAVLALPPLHVRAAADGLPRRRAAGPVPRTEHRRAARRGGRRRGRRGRPWRRALRPVRRRGQPDAAVLRHVRHRDLHVPARRGPVPVGPAGRRRHLRRGCRRLPVQHQPARCLHRHRFHAGHHPAAGRAAEPAEPPGRTARAGSATRASTGPGPRKESHDPDRVHPGLRAAEHHQADHPGRDGRRCVARARRRGLQRGRAGRDRRGRPGAGAPQSCHRRGTQGHQPAVRGGHADPVRQSRDADPRRHPRADPGRLHRRGPGDP